MKSKEISSSSKAKPETVGEELYLVHLRRHEGEEPRVEDFDFENPPRKRSYSTGEELWNVHVKRSRGLEPDIDCKKPEGSSGHDELPKEDTKPCRYNLRTRRREPKSP
jgi:hypothetical protein